MKFDLTPWARNALSNDDYAEIQRDAPDDVIVDIGRSTGWTCRVRRGGTILGEAYGASTPILAFREALVSMDEPPDTNREGQPEFNGAFG